MSCSEYIKIISKPLLLICLGLGFFLPPVNAYSQQGHINCFVYHRFGDQRYPSTNIDTETFREQLKYLKDHNYHVLTLEAVVHMITANAIIPEKTAVITIDDAYGSFYAKGLPVLEEFGYPATLFINTNTVGGSDFMSWKEINDARDRGIEIGNHSHSHHHFLDIPDDDKRADAFEQDLKTSHKMFLEHLGSKPGIFSYPYGEFDSFMVKVLKEYRYSGAAAQYSGVLYPGSDLYIIPRFPMGGPYATLEGFINKLQALPFKIIRQLPENIRLTNNPPQLQIDIPRNTIETNSLQCFVDGKQNCKLEIVEGDAFISLFITSKVALSGRRSLYTITARSLHSKGWCWHSHVWVNTDVAEE
jgi:peptidoglycan/xylan/chitin deacetylase (PgdA/CDA1 family)